MKNFESEIAEILEVETINLSDELESFEAWDSLTVLSIIAFCDSEYKVTLSSEDINNAETIQGLKDMIIENK